MSTRRDMLAFTAGAVAARTILPIAARAKTGSPDAALLARCAQLEEMQDEWQRLYDATSDEDELTTPADHAWQAYSDDVWPRSRAPAHRAAPAGTCQRCC